MDFTRDSTQTIVAEMVDGLIAREPADLWAALSGAGLSTMLLPEAAGGDGLGLPEAAVVLTELAKHAAVGPALATIGFGIVPLTALAGPEVIARIAQPGAILTAARAHRFRSTPPPRRFPTETGCG